MEWYKVEVWRNIATVPTKVFDSESSTSYNPNSQEEIISIRASQTVSGEVSEAQVVFDNDPTKDLAENDVVLIWFTSNKDDLGTYPYKKVFSGVVYEASEASNDEDKTVTLRAKDWSFLLLTGKVNLSYPDAGEITENIVLDIIDSCLAAPPVAPCDLHISGIVAPGDIEPTCPPAPFPGQTRQLDFVGEAIPDALNKLDDVTERDWYVDPEKAFKWFLRFSKPSIKIGVNAFKSWDLDNYVAGDPLENLCNRVWFYGKDNKCYPIDKDSLTEVGVPFWYPPLFDWRSVGDSTSKKAGSKSITCTSVHTYLWNGNIGMIRELPEHLDLTQKESFQILRWASRTMLPMPQNPSSSMQFDESLDYEVYLQDGSGILIKYNNFNKPLMERSSSQNPQFMEFSVPLGPSHEIDGEWAISDKAYPNEHPHLLLVAYDPTGGGVNPEVGLTKVGTDPYIDVDVGDGSYIEGTMGSNSGDFTFAPTGGSATKVWDAFIIVTFRGAGAYHADNDYGTIGMEIKVGGTTHTAAGGIRVRHLTYQTMMIGIPQFFANEADFDSMKMLFRFEGLYADQHIRISHAESFFCGSDATVGTFDWTDVAKVMFVWTFFTADQDSGKPYLYIDWLHFDNGRWFGEHDDISSQTTYGLKFKEIFDDTVYSDTAANRRAEKYVDKFKIPITVITDVIADFIGQEQLKVGEYVNLDVPENIDPSTNYRIETITWEWGEDGSFQTSLVLSLDPIPIEGRIHSISERVRRVEQKYQRKPVVEPTEFG